MYGGGSGEAVKEQGLTPGSLEQLVEADYQVKHNLELLGSQGSSFMSEVTCLALQFQVTKRPLTKASGSLRGDTQGDEANSGGDIQLQQGIILQEIGGSRELFEAVL